MENGIHNGVRTDHDRDTLVNSLRGKGTVGAELLNTNDANPDDVTGPGGKPVANGASDVVAIPEATQPNAKPASPAAPRRPQRMNDLPDEIQHITTEMMPLSLLIGRLAQITHNQLQDVIGELATKSIPPVAVNGHGADYRNTAAEDMNADSLVKKEMFLKFIQGLHAKWTKALVITDWSKKASAVGKLIDIKVHMEKQLRLYDQTAADLVNAKTDLLYARLPSPDLRTALQVLKTGEAPWMPEFNYIESPVMTPQEQLNWIEHLNTLLSLRLSVEEYERIPFHFRDYAISSGRVTFKVKGEFEVDLTIADEDFEQQFWFIDFRFLFSPAPAELPDTLRVYLEARVNEKLATEGLAGCYSFLHEFVLTHKITEFMRQAMELSRGRWIDTLKVERLNRALSIQYWATRYPAANAPKSWIILGVHSGGRRPGSGQQADPASSSRLSLRWFRDNKEVKDVEIDFDTEQISAQDLLKAAIARHVEHILSTIHSRMKAKPRFANREGALSLQISRTEPMSSSLVMQLSGHQAMTTRVEVVTGLFSLEPHSRIFVQGEQRLSYNVKDPAEEGSGVLESIRWAHAAEELNRRGRSFGWTVVRVPLRPDELKQVINTREAFQVVWLKRQGWTTPWYLMLSLSLAGDQWWLIELSTTAQPNPRIVTHMSLPLGRQQPDLSSRFFRNLTIFATGVIAHVADTRELKARKISLMSRVLANASLPPQVKLPTVFARLSDLLPSTGGGARRRWAFDYVCILYGGPQAPSSQRSPLAKPDGKLEVVAEARLRVMDKARFAVVTGSLGSDVAFNDKLGLFALRLRAEVGQSVVGALEVRLRALERLVDFIDAIRRQGTGVRCDKVTLQEAVFTYGGGDGDDEQTSQRWTARLDLSRLSGARLVLDGSSNPHHRVLDMLNQLIASRAGLERLPHWLLLTLPLLRGLDKLSEAWRQPALDNKGSVEVMHRTLGWLVVRFLLIPAAAASGEADYAGQGQERRLILNVRLRSRRGELWWHVHRVGRDAANGGDGGGSGDNGDDEFSTALKQHVWDSRGDGWRGLATGAAARPDGVGTEGLLGAVDAAMQSLLGRLPPAHSGGSQQIVSEGSVTTGTATMTTAPGGMSFSQSQAGGGSSQGRGTQLTQPGSSQSQGARAGGARAKAPPPPVVVVVD